MKNKNNKDKEKGKEKEKEKENEDAGVDFLSLLPSEISMEIFSYFSPSELAAISLVCKQGRQLAEDPSFWQAILKNKMKSTYRAERGQEKHTASVITRWSKLNTSRLALIAKLDMESAKLILQTPDLAEKLIHGDDTVQIGVAHVEAAFIILESPELLMKCGVEGLLEIASAHESIARQFLDSEEFTESKLTVFNPQQNQDNANVKSSVPNPLTAEFLNTLRQSSSLRHENIAISLLRTGWMGGVIIDLTTLGVKHPAVTEMILSTSDLRRAILATNVNSFQPLYRISELFLKHNEYAQWLADPVFFKQLTSDFYDLFGAKTGQYEDDHSFSIRNTYRMNSIPNLICVVVASNESLSSAILANQDILKMYGEEGMLIKILNQIISSHYNMAKDIFKQHAYFENVVMNISDKYLIGDIAKNNPEMVNDLIENNHIFNQLEPSQQQELIKMRSDKKESETLNPGQLGFFVPPSTSSTTTHQPESKGNGTPKPGAGEK